MGEKTRKLPDGGLEVAFRVAGLDEIKRWILSFDPEAEVLQPERLRKMVQLDLSRTLGKYSVRATPAVRMVNSRA